MGAGKSIGARLRPSPRRKELSAHCRTADTCRGRLCRHFWCVIKVSSLTTAPQMAHRLRRLVSSQPFYSKNKTQNIPRCRGSDVLKSRSMGFPNPFSSTRSDIEKPMQDRFVHALLLRFSDRRSPNQERVALFVHERLGTRLVFT